MNGSAADEIVRIAEILRITEILRIAEIVRIDPFCSFLCFLCFWLK